MWFFLVLERIVYISGHLPVKKPSRSVLPTSDLQEWCSGCLRKWERYRWFALGHGFKFKEDYGP